MKRLLLLSLTLMICLIGRAQYSWTDANGTIWFFSTDASNATIESGISGTIPNDLVVPSTVYVDETAYPVTSIGGSAFRNCRSLTNITLPEGIQSIGSYAFYNCGSLTSIIIPQGVQSIETGVFYYCI